MLILLLLLVLLPRRQLHPNKHNEMASQKTYIMDPVHRCFSDPMCSNHVKPPDKAKMSYLAARKYIRTLILWLLLISFYNKVPIQICKLHDPVMNITENVYDSTTNYNTVFHSVQSKNMEMNH